MGLFGPNIKGMQAAQDVPGLMKLLNDPNLKTQNAAKAALVAINEPACIADVIQVMENPARDPALADRVVEKLVKDLSASAFQKRRRSAQILGEMFRTGRLPPAAVQMILSNRDKISQPHQDQNQHKDGPHWDESIFSTSSDCSNQTSHSHTDRMVTRPGELYKRKIDKNTHIDTGIGEQF